MLAVAATVAKRLGAVREYSRELFSAMFAESGVARIDRAECARRAQRCSNLEPEFERELDSSDTASELSKTLDAAQNLGIFGVPSFVAGGELFWGNDRMVLLRHHILQHLSGQPTS